MGKRSIGLNVLFPLIYKVVAVDLDVFFNWLTKNQDPSLAAKLQKKWASTYTDNRLLIRKDIYKALKHKSVLDLTKIPRVPDKNISISHCPIMGGYILSDRPVGIDFEQYRRISLKLVERVIAKEEGVFFKDYPYQILWTIKESAYKALHLQNIPVTEIKIKKIEVIKVDSELSVYKSLCDIKDQKAVNYSVINEELDLVCSVSYEI